MKSILLAATALSGLLAASPLPAQTPKPPAAETVENAAAHIDSLASAMAWLTNKSTRMIHDCRRPMKNGVMAFPPQVGGGYDAFWLRDYAYMLEGNVEAFSSRELKDSYLFFLAGQRADGAMMDCIQYNGTPFYMPAGNRGLNPIADGSQFAVDVAWHTFRGTRDTNLVAQTVDKLIKAMKAAPLNPATGLIHIKPGAAFDRVGYGFTDQMRKQGDELFCSLLYVQASRQLAGLLAAAGRGKEAKAWTRIAEKTAGSVRRVFWDPQTGLFRAATVVCNQPDLWGSAFAVYLGVADRAQKRAIATYFKDHYGEIVKRGQLRHLPGGMSWEMIHDPVAHGTFQNGAYWATPIGWFVYTLDLADPKLADQTVIDMVLDFVATNDENECVNDNYRNVTHYLASTCLPLDGLRAMCARRDAAANSGRGRAGH